MATYVAAFTRCPLWRHSAFSLRDIEMFYLLNMFRIKFSTFSFFTELYDVIFTDFRAILRWMFLMKFYSIFENRLPGIGLCRYPKYSIWPQNGLKLDYIHVLMEKTSTVRKMENSVCLLNPITGNCYICSRVYQVPFMTS